MPRTTERCRSLRCRSQRKRPDQQSHTRRCPTRLASTSQLMAQGSGLVLPRLGTVPVMHRLIADDRLAVMLAKALLELDIASPEIGKGRTTTQHHLSGLRLSDGFTRKAVQPSAADSCFPP